MARMQRLSNAFVPNFVLLQNGTVPTLVQYVGGRCCTNAWGPRRRRVVRNHEAQGEARTKEGGAGWHSSQSCRQRMLSMPVHLKGALLSPPSVPSPLSPSPFPRTSPTATHSTARVDARTRDAAETSAAPPLRARLPWPDNAIDLISTSHRPHIDPNRDGLRLLPSGEWRVALFIVFDGVAGERAGVVNAQWRT